MIDAFTDYPFESCGDVAGQTAPIRKVKILTYDQDKYCDILVYFVDSDGDERGYVDSIKAGYLYKNEATWENGVTFSYDELKVLPLRFI